MSTNYIGQALARTDGPLKVTGQATYAGEFRPSNLAYGYIVESTIAKGKIVSIHTKKAEEISGILAVFTHKNLPKKLKNKADYTDPLAPPGQPFRPLYNEEILYNGQPIALVVATNFELARYAAGLIEVEYETTDFVATLRENLENATTEDVSSPPEPRGNAAAAYADSPYQVEAEYEQPRHYHNPMEPHSTTVEYGKDGSLVIYDKIQGVASTQDYICGIFGMDEKKVRVKSPFVGGGFGSGLRPQYQAFLATLAATELIRSVTVTLTRRQMFSFGYRSSNLQRLKLSANQQGQLTSIQHQSYGVTSMFEKFSEDVVSWSGVLYKCGNSTLEYELVPLDAYTSLDTRGPGGTTGMFALECAMDELAVKAGIDPLEFRFINYSDRDQNANLPFSSKELKACYTQCAERFGWKNRKATPRSVVKGNHLVGYGMATGIWEAMQQPASVKARLNAKGELTVYSATADIGTGTYVVMTQIAAETFGLPLEKVTFRLGDTNMPNAPIEGGSWTVSSVGSAVQNVCEDLRKKLFDLAKSSDIKQFKNATYEDATFKNGAIALNNGTTITYEAIMRTTDKSSLTKTSTLKPKDGRDKVSCFAHSCVMVEVHVDKDLGTISIPRIVNAAAAGKIINPKTAENQLLGATVWGIGMALEEEAMIDKQFGRIMNANLAEYQVAVNADVQDIEIIFVEEHDTIVNPLGAKGIGELGIVGTAAAIANAVYNATGKRIRKLPITLDKLL